MKYNMCNKVGSYVFLIMPFGINNAPTTFCNLVNGVLYEFLYRFVVVYLNDIVLYSENLDAHVEHLKKVFARLRQHQLYVKKKNELCRSKMMFLGYWIG